jgi:putative spermidine/putrescine transport system substrate-binding protein
MKHRISTTTHAAIRRSTAVLGLLTATFTTAPVGAQERINVSTYSGVWNIAQRACVVDPFNQANKDIQVVAEPAVSSVTLTKMRQQKDKPEIDVAWLDGNFSEQAQSEGLVEALDPSSVPNAADLVPSGVFKTKDGKIYALGTGFYSTGILYNTSKVTAAPTSWWDLWKPEFANRVITPSPAQAIFIPLFLHLNKLLGGTLTNFDPVVNKFRELKAAAYFDSTGVVQSAIQSGEVTVGAYYVNATWSLADQNMPVAAAIPKEGVPAGDTRIHVAKNSSKRKAAEKFVNFAVSPDALNCLGEKLYLGPPLKAANLKLSDNAKKKMPWGENGSVDSLVMPDWNYISEKRNEIVEIWNRRVVSK